jgi:glutamine synthetase
VGDAYGAEALPPLPRSLRDAIDAFEASTVAADLLGAEVVGHYVHAYRTEQAAFDAAVTDWERQRYFERI